MKCGIVDMGSNTVQLTLYHYEGSSFRPLFNRWETVGLASYVEGGVLNEDGIKAACRVLSEFQTLLQDLEVPRLYVFATASLRNISNAHLVTAAIHAKTGIAVELLSGQDEAAYSFKGAMLGAPSPDGLMADIGGGSTELVAYAQNAPRSEISLPVGGVTLFSRFVDGVLPTPAEQNAMTAYIAPLLDAALLSPCQSILGVGGTARAVVRLCSALSGAEFERHTVSAREIASFYNLLARGDKDSLRLLLRTAPDRVHTVFPGLILLQGILMRCGAETLTMSTTGVREGYLLSCVMRAER
jgi:exopolyphosphatase/guanosine-5'-triphosphate,3'-diphosphate pyrophosphatase